MENIISSKGLMISEKEKSESIKEYLYRVIRTNIIYGYLSPGDVISENYLAEVFHVSRTPIREATAHLVNDELLEVYPQKGTYVSHIDMKRVKEATILRQLLEVEACQRSCEEITEERVYQLEANLNAQQFYYGQNKLIEVMELDNDFHKLIFESVSLLRIWNAIQTISYDSERVRYLKLSNHFRWEETLKEHWEIAEGIKQRDKKLVSELMAKHVGKLYEDAEKVREKYKEWFAG
ncbi:MAG TPA: GntR family transcriptional regulator [Clostridiales bacterium]|nr:GntR family transcriptional regulator [Clostridiales bacterium]